MRRLKVYCISDIHLELYSIVKQRKLLSQLCQSMTIDPKVTTLCCLAGDIGHSLTRNGQVNHTFGEALRFIASHFTHTVYTSGNHEYHMGFRASEIDAAITKLCSLNRVKYLQRSSFNVPNTSVIVHGCTLWSKITRDEYHRMYDRHYMSLEAYQQKHKSDVEFLQSAKVAGMTNIVMTHHMPSYEMIHPRFLRSPAKSGFVSHLDHLIRIYDFWVCGHTHEQVNLKLNGQLRVVTNPVGYNSESRWTPQLRSHVYEI